MTTPYIDPRNAPYNAVGDGTTNDAVALNSAIAAAIAAKTVLDGGGATYGVSGDLTITGATNPHLRNLTLKQLSPNTSGRKTLLITNSNKVILENIKIDRNGNGQGGSLNDAAGLWLEGGTGHHLGLVEVYGNDKGTGIAIHNVADSKLEDLYVHDIAFDAPSATDDLVQGVWLNVVTNSTISARVFNLTGNAHPTLPNRFTRGVAMGGCIRCTLLSPKIRDVDQGIDLSGSAGNIDCLVLGGHLRNVNTWGVKLANSAVRCKVIDTTVENAGMAGFVASGPSEQNLPNKTEDCEFINCTALNPRYHTAFSEDERSGFRVMPHDHDQNYPKGIKIIGCRAIDLQNPKRMDYGFRNSVTYDGAGKINEIVDSTSIGHLIGFSTGFGSWTCFAYGGGTQTLASGTPTVLSFAGAVIDGAGMHNSGSSRITIVQPGDYRVVGKVTFAGSAVGQRRAFLKKNGATDSQSRATTANAGAVGTTITTAPLELRLVAGDYIELWAEHQSSGSLDVDRGESFLQVSLVRTI